MKGSVDVISSNVFNYINVLNKAADASWARNEVITNNIVNVDTPNYKRKDVQFEAYLMAELATGDDLNTTIHNLDLDAIEATTYVENSGISYRADGNNVNIDTESAEYAKNQMRYYTLLDSMTQEFSRIQMVLSRN